MLELFFAEPVTIIFFSSSGMLWVQVYSKNIGLGSSSLMAKIPVRVQFDTPMLSLFKYGHCDWELNLQFVICRFEDADLA